MTKVAGSSGLGASTDAGGYKVPVVPASANGAGKGGSNSGNAASIALKAAKNGAPVLTSIASTAPAASTSAAAFDSKQYSSLYEPTSFRSWEKSRMIDFGNGSVAPSTPTQAELNAQLRPEGEEELVPLHAIAGRMVQYAWQLFANQVEINPSLSPLERRNRIYEDAHEARKQLIKLLVLVQWSKSAPELQMARNLIGLVNGHIFQSMAAIEAISETRSMLSNARLRNYDLITAIEVLSRGGPQSIPASFKDLIRPQSSYTDAEAIALVAKLDDVLRLRLASEEMLAMPMLSYTISDGRACFVAHQLFEADLTLSGSSPEDRWWLLRVKFDFRITGAGAEKFPRQLRGQQRLNLLELADGELAPRSVATAATEMEAGQGIAEPGDEAIADEQNHISAFMEEENSTLELRKDAPLVRLYNLLQSQSLHYRLDILHWQAAQLVKLSWHQRLMVFFDASRVLHLRYWRKPRDTREGMNDEWDPCSEADICISVTDESEPRQGAVGMIKSLFEKSDDRGHKPAILEVAAHWDIQGVAVDFLDSHVIPVNHHALDAHALLLDVVQRHAKAAISAFRARIESSVLSKTMKLDTQSRSVDSIEEHTLLITVHERLTVVLSIDRLSGQVKLEERSSASSSLRNESLSCATLASLTRLNYVREASKAINERPRMIVGVLQRLRCQILLDDLEEKCALVGLPCTKRMPLRQADYAQLQATPSTLLFVVMQQCPSYYLVLHVDDDSIQVALMCACTFLQESITSMRIISLERLDWTFVLRSCLRKGSHHGKRKLDVEVDMHSLEQSSVTISEDDLAALHSYSVALICYHKVEEQLRQRSIPYVHVGGLNGRPGHDSISHKDDACRYQSADDFVASIVPSLRIDSSALLGASSGTFTSPNLLLRLHRWTDSRQCRVEMAMKIKLQSNIVTRDRIVDGSDEVFYDAASGVLTFSIANVDNCFERFLTGWRRIEKVLELVRLIGRQQRQDSLQQGSAGVTRKGVALDTFDMTHVAFRYGDDMSASVGWVQDLGRSKQGYFALAFTTATKATKGDTNAKPIWNPHNIMRQALQEALNQGDESKPLFWPMFLNLLQRPLPVALAVRELPDTCLQDVREPELDVKSANWIRLTFLDRFTLDVRLLQGERVLFHNAGRSMSGPSTSKELEGGGDATQFAPSSDDPFVLSMLEPIDAIHKHTANEWNAIPSFDAIVRVVADTSLQQNGDAASLANQQKQEQPLFMTFSDALLYKGDPARVQWILRQLKKRIASALDQLLL